MTMTKKYVFLFLLCCLLLFNACSKSSANDQASAPVCGVGNFDPIALVNTFLTTNIEDDPSAYFGTLAKYHEPDVPFMSPSYLQHIYIYSIRVDDSATTYFQRMIRSEFDKELNLHLKAENILGVIADYDAQYDNTKTGATSGRQTWKFMLIRENTEAPWTIATWGP